MQKVANLDLYIILFAVSKKKNKKNEFLDLRCSTSQTYLLGNLRRECTITLFESPDNK